MKEYPYTAELTREIESEIGGKVVKISDRSTLGLPDSMHIQDGIVTYIESKISTRYVEAEDGIYVQPWASVKKDIRQYEVCRSMSRHALVVYAIYWPKIKMSAILPMDILAKFRPLNEDSEPGWLCHPNYLAKGKGLDQLKRIMQKNRENVYGKIASYHW